MKKKVNEKIFLFFKSLVQTERISVARKSKRRQLPHHYLVTPAWVLAHHTHPSPHPGSKFPSPFCRSDLTLSCSIHRSACTLPPLVADHDGHTQGGQTAGLTLYLEGFFSKLTRHAVCLGDCLQVHADQDVLLG